MPAIQFIAGVGVSLFLICSGYGMEKSFQKNGLKDFWKKRILSVYIPFVVVIIFTNVIEVCLGKPFNIREFIAALLLVKVNWYLQFLAICYIVFFVIKIIAANAKNKKCESALWWLYILIAFVIYSVYIADESAPFLQARQVMCFPLGLYIAQNTYEVERKLNKCGWLGIILLGVVGIAFMGITQMPYVKSMPYIISNSMALLTCLPLAISVLIFMTNYPKMLYNKMLEFCGIISYELFLVHIKTLSILNNTVQSWIAFSLLTAFCVAILYVFDKKIGSVREKL